MDLNAEYPLVTSCWNEAMQDEAAQCEAVRGSRDQFAGCVLGLALGDALGAPFEGGPIERFVWRLIGRTRKGEMRWTDDTQMSLDLAESLIARGALDPDDLAARFSKSYRWSRGYGPGAARLLERIRGGMTWEDASRSVFPDGSFGNGGAMCAPIVGLFYASSPSILVQAARDSARVTHAHPLGIEGAVLIAAAVSRAFATSKPEKIFDFAAGHCEQEAFRKRLEIARRWIAGEESPKPDEVVTSLGHGITALESCVTGLYLGVRFLRTPFEQLCDFVARCGGDVDTIGAMSGAIWGTVHGASSLPETRLRTLEQRARLEKIGEQLWRASGG